LGPVKATPIDLVVPLPRSVNELPAFIELPVLSTVIVLVAPEDVKVTVAESLIVRLFIVGLTLTVIFAFILITTL
jgi:hypothetical protein